MNANKITTPAQALAQLEAAQALIEAVLVSPAMSCAPTNDARVVEWTQDQGETLMSIVSDINETIECFA